MRLFLDANVLFTAAYRAQGLSRGLFRLAQSGRCTLCTSAFAHEEALRNIQKNAPDRLGELTVLMEQVGLLPEPFPAGTAWAEALPLACKDAPVLAAAIQGRVELFVTGDRRDFGHLFGQVVKGVRILNPAAALAAVVSGQDATR